MDSLIQDTLAYIEQNYHFTQTKVVAPPVTKPSPPPPKQKAPSWIEKKSAAPIAMIYHLESAEEFALLERFKDAVTAKIGTAVLVSGTTLERQHGWDQFLQSPTPKLVCVTESSLRGLPTLVGQRDKLLVMPDMREFIQTPQLRRTIFDKVATEYGRL